MSGVGVALCTYNRENLVLDCISSLLAQSYPHLMIHLVDNASSDCTVERVMTTYMDHVQLIQHEENLGSSGGVFRAVQEAYQNKPNYILVMDSDCMLGKGALAAMVNYMDSHHEVAMLGPKIYHGNQRQCIQELGAHLDWEQGLFRKNYSDYDESIDGVLNVTETVDYAPTCCLLVRRGVIESIGNIDPTYFLYFDDIEWAHRVRLGGGKVVATSGAHAFHFGGAALKRNHLITYYYWRNRIRFFNQYAPAMDTQATILNVLQQICRAIATSCTLELNNTGYILQCALDDALAKRTGRRDFAPEKIVLDDTSPYLLFDTNLNAAKVQHLFEQDPQALGLADDVVLADDFGKHITVAQCRLLYSKFLDLYDKIYAKYSMHFES